MFVSSSSISNDKSVRLCNTNSLSLSLQGGLDVNTPYIVSFLVETSPVSNRICMKDPKIGLLIVEHDIDITNHNSLEVIKNILDCNYLQYMRKGNKDPISVSRRLESTSFQKLFNGCEVQSVAFFLVFTFFPISAGTFELAVFLFPVSIEQRIICTVSEACDCRQVLKGLLKQVSKHKVRNLCTYRVGFWDIEETRYIR